MDDIIAQLSRRLPNPASTSHSQAPSQSTPSTHSDPDRKIKRKVMHFNAASLVQIPDDAPLQRYLVREKARSFIGDRDYPFIRLDLMPRLRLMASKEDLSDAPEESFYILALFDLANPSGVYRRTLGALSDAERKDAKRAIEFCLERDRQDRVDSIDIRNAWQLWPWKLWADADWCSGLLGKLASFARLEPLFGTARKKLQDAIDKRNKQEENSKMIVRKQLIIDDVQAVLKQCVSAGPPNISAARPSISNKPAFRPAKRQRLSVANVMPVNNSRGFATVPGAALSQVRQQEHEVPIVERQTTMKDEGTVILPKENAAMEPYSESKTNEQSDRLATLAEAQNLDLSFSLSQAAHRAVGTLTRAIMFDDAAHQQLKSRVAALETLSAAQSTAIDIARTAVAEELATIIALRREIETAHKDAADIIALVETKQHMFPPSVHEYIASQNVKKEPTQDKADITSSRSKESESNALATTSVLDPDSNNDAAKTFFFATISRPHTLAESLAAAHKRDEAKSEAVISATAALDKSRKELATAKLDYENSEVAKLRKKRAVFSAIAEKLEGMTEAELKEALDIKVNVDDM